MKQSIFITLATTGLLISGLTWASPPDEETQTAEEPVMEETIEEVVPDVPETTQEQEFLSFEEAMSLCAYEIDVQACVDEKTGQDRMDDEMVIDPTDTMDGEMDSEIVIDPESCDLDSESMEDCPE